MGNTFYTIASHLYVVIRQKINIYLYGQLTQGPVGLTLNEINEFEQQFTAFSLKRRYGHRLDTPVEERFKVTIAAPGHSETKGAHVCVEPRQKPELDPIVVPFDQLNLNCNTTNAVSLLIQWFMVPHCALQPYVPSRLYLYHEARVNSDQDTDLLDEGVSFSDVFAVLNLNIPIPDELEWPYNIKSVNEHPGKYEDMVYIPYTGVQLQPSLPNLKTCLEQNGPFVAAVSVSKDFELYGKYKYDPSELVQGFQPLLFTHFLEEQQAFIAINSFGPSWGDRGRVTLPVKDLLQDPAFLNSVYTLVPDALDTTDEEKSD
jgi:hypothetical protein